MGPSANTDICSENARVGEFRDNHAHSMGRYGLRVFHNMMPREYPCKPMEYDFDKPEDPWHSNRPITANFNGFTAWKTRRDGAIGLKMADVRFNNFKTADNMLAGVEMSRFDAYTPNHIDMGGLYNALLIGRSSNTERRLDRQSPIGVIGPRTEGFVIRGAKFYNFDFNDAAALGSCSHCIHD